MAADRRLVPAAILPLALCAFGPSCAGAELPPVVLWAWERPCDLSGVDPREVGVAFLALTLRLDADGIAPVPRRQPLRLPAAARRVAVVRIETDRRRAPRLDAVLAEEAAGVAAAAAGGNKVAAVQVDFDAAVAERPFYRDFLGALRRRLPPETPLSMTALASWCLGDRWLAGLPVDEAVPMLFRMGTDDAQVRQRLAAGEDFAEPLCRGSVGLADDEPAPPSPRGRRRYVFLAGGCGPAEIARALRPPEGDR